MQQKYFCGIIQTIFEVTNHSARPTKYLSETLVDSNVFFLSVYKRKLLLQIMPDFFLFRH